MIRLVNISKIFQNCEALKEVNLNIDDNTFVAITGKSGSGKSTLLSIMSGLDAPTSGQVIYDKEDINKFDDKRMSKFRNESIGFIFQNFFLEADYTVMQNVEMPLMFRKIKNRKSVCLDALSRIGLMCKANEKVKNLSGGEQQRCAIARALITNPQVIFADEPCGNLDTVNSQTIMNILLELKKRNKTILLVTHNLADANKADRIITLQDGRIIRDEYVCKNCAKRIQNTD